MPTKAKAAYIEEEDPETGKTTFLRSSARKKVEIKQESQHINDRRSSQKGSESSSNDSRRTTNAVSSPSPLKRVESSKHTSKAERRMSSSSTASPKKAPTRPPSAHKNASFPQVDSRTHIQPILIQQQPQHRALIQAHPRPSSFHEGMYNAYPPISNSAFYNPQSNSLIPAPSYQPPSPISSYATYANGSSTYHPSSISTLPPAFRQDYSTPQLPIRTLEERLGGESKARRRSTAVYYSDRGYDSAYERSASVASIARKSSTRKTQEQVDRERMPPPPSLSRRRMSVTYPDTDSLDDDDEPPYEQPRVRQIFKDEKAQLRARRPSMTRGAATYAYGPHETRVEPERNDNRGRRNSYYTVPSAPANNYEEKLRAADSYQTSVGGPETRLTAETLKKASRRAHPPSSQSTRSSGSRDESERQRSSVTTRTTGTTRTGAGDEDITIKLKGQGKIKIAGAEIDYDKDTELNIRRTGGNVGGGGSQRSSDYGASEDRRDRRERASDRSRLSSNARVVRERQGYF